MKLYHSPGACSPACVPLLELDDGRRLTEVPAIVQYLADQKPELRARTWARL